MASALFVIGAAFAHVPHDSVAAMALPDDLDEAGAWVALVSAHLPLLVQRDDRGFYQLIGGEPMGDAPVAAAQLGDGTIVLLGTTDLWWSGDGLASWEHAVLPGRVDQLVVSGETLFVAGLDGVWAGLPGSLIQILEDEARFISSGGAVAAVGAVDEVRRYDGGAWRELGVVAGVSAVLATETDTFVGTTDGAVQRWAGGEWAPCGALPKLAEEHGDVVVLAADPLDPGVIYAATGVDGPYRSDDGCASFEARFGTSNIQYGGEGSPEDPHDAITTIRADGDRVIVAGWMGLFSSADAGESWEASALLPVDYLRGLSAVSGVDGAVVVVEGPYASGPIRSVDEGVSWTGANAGLTEDNVQEVVVDPHDPSRLYAVVGHLGFVSRDGGASWDATDPAELGSFDPDDEVSGVVWASGREGVLRSDDAGATWAGVPGLPATGHFVGHVVWGGYDDCVATSGPTEVWCEQVDTWTLLFESEERAVGMGVSGAALILGVESGVLVYFTAFPEQKLGPLVADKLLAIAVSDDGTTFAGTQSGLVYRSVGNGDGWEALPFRATAPVWSLAPLPDFFTRRAVLLGTLDGAYVVEGAAAADISLASLSRWAPEQWVDDASHYFLRSGCPESAAATGYGLDTRTLLTPGCSLTSTVRGSHLRLRGTSAGTAHADVLVDGELVASIGGRVVSAPGVLLDVASSAGWHRVELVGIGGEGLFLDSLEANDAVVEAGEVGDSGAEPDPEPDCGCGSGGSASVAGAVIVAAIAVRRRGQGIAIAIASIAMAIP